jgi:hypothetical protein
MAASHPSSVQYVTFLVFVSYQLGLQMNVLSSHAGGSEGRATVEDYSDKGLISGKIA